MDEIADLRLFLEVVANGSFTRAAKVVHFSQPALSKRMAALEKSLGGALFRRHRGGVSVTPAGAALLPYAQRLVFLAHDAEEAVRATTAPIADITVGFWLPPGGGTLGRAAAEFRSAHPDLRVEPRLMHWTHRMAAIEDGVADVGLIWVPSWWDLPDLSHRVLAREPVVLVVAPGHPLFERDIVFPEDLLNETIVDGPANSAGGLDLAKWFSSRPYRTRPATTIDEAAEYIAVGVAVAVLPASLARAHIAEPLQVRPLRVGPVQFIAAWRTNDENVERIEELVDAIGRAHRATRCERSIAFRIDT